jgi:hypothetical protein
MKRCSRPTFAALPAGLAFANHMDRLVAGDRAPGGPKRTEVLTRVDPSLDRTVVLFQDVIQVRHRPVPAIPLKGAFGFESNDRGRVRASAAKGFADQLEYRAQSGRAGDPLQP